MAIGLVEMNGMDMRTQDFSIMKHHEDSRPMVEQQHIQQGNEKKVEHDAHSVKQGGDSAKSGNHADAREKGSNTYMGDGGKNRRKAQMDGKVIIKGNKGFDMSV